MKFGYDGDKYKLEQTKKEAQHQFFHFYFEIAQLAREIFYSP